MMLANHSCNYAIHVNVYVNALYKYTTKTYETRKIEGVCLYLLFVNEHKKTDERAEHDETHASTQKLNLIFNLNLKK